MVNRVLVVDDDLDLCELLDRYLRREGFEFEMANDGERGIKRALSSEHALVVLDIMLPGINGFEALRYIRSESQIPILMLTARGDDVDRIVGLEMGADDYLPKPFNPRELIARIRAVLRRTKKESGPATTEASRGRLIAGDITLDKSSQTVYCAGRPVALTVVEFTLLEILLRSLGRIVTREEMVKTVLGRNFDPHDRSIDIHVSHLRQKLGVQPGRIERIKTVRGVGYIFPDPQEPKT
jgi:two-component system, OmpR family, response regulator CpxR